MYKESRVLNLKALKLRPSQNSEKSDLNPDEYLLEYITVKNQILLEAKIEDLVEEFMDSRARANNKAIYPVADDQSGFHRQSSMTQASSSQAQSRANSADWRQASQKKFHEELEIAIS